MDKLKLIFICLLLFFPLKSYAIDYYKVENNTGICYSPYSGFFAADGTSEDKIMLTKEISENQNGFSIYSYKNDKLNLKSDFEFIYNKKLYGIDNKNLKYFEILYENSKFVEYQLTYEQAEKLFEDSDVVKISDFKNGKYRVLNVCKDKKILLFNDTDKCFEGFEIKPDKFSSDKNIKGLISLPYWGKVVFTGKDDKNVNGTLTVKVR